MGTANAIFKKRGKGYNMLGMFSLLLLLLFLHVSQDPSIDNSRPFIFSANFSIFLNARNQQCPPFLYWLWPSSNPKKTHTHTHPRIKPEQFIVTFIISVKLFILIERKFFPTCCLKVTEIKQRKNKRIDFNFSLFSWAKFILERRELYHLLTVNNF